MFWITTALSLAGSIFEGIQWLFGDDGITLEDLTRALNEAVDEIANRTYLIVSTQFEYHELQEARDKIETAQHLLQAYHNMPDKDRLHDAEVAAVEAYSSLNNDVDLIAGSPAPDYPTIRGKGLLGHPWFLIAANLIFMVYDEWIRIYDEEGQVELEKGARRMLRQTLEEAILTAEQMQFEWITWTQRRFTPLELRVKESLIWSYDHGILLPKLRIRYRWIYWFNGEKKIAAEVIWETGDDTDKIQQGAISANNVWLEHLEYETEKVKDAFVNPSREVVREWHHSLWILGLVPEGFEKAYVSIENANDTAYGTQYIMADSFRKTHPEIIVDREEPVSESKPSLLAKIARKSTNGVERHRTPTGQP
jgi:hypothetical protein